MVRTNTRAGHKMRAEFFAEGKRLDADPSTREQANCWLCKQRINYSVPPHSTPDSHNLDHYHTVTEHPELEDDPTNARHSHMLCNNKRGARTPSLGLGKAVGDWW